MVVGDGKTSVNRCGGPLGESLFQMLLLQGKGVLLGLPLPKVAFVEVPPLEPHGNWSLDGAEVPGLMGENGPLVPSEPLRLEG